MSDAPASAPAPSPAADAGALPKLGELMGIAWRALLARLPLFLALWFATDLLGWAFTSIVGAALGLSDPESVRAAAKAGRYAPIAVLTAAGLLSRLIGAVGFLAAAIAAAEHLAGREPSARASLEAALGRLLAVLWTGVVVVLRVLGGLILLVVPGLILAVLYGYSHLAAALEGLSGGAAARRSWELVRPVWPKVVGNMLVFAMVGAAATFAAAIPAALLRAVLSVAAGALGAAVGEVVLRCAAGVAGAWITCASVALYQALARRAPLPAPAA